MISHSPPVGHFAALQCHTMIYSAVAHTFAHWSLATPLIIPLEQIPRSEIAEMFAIFIGFTSNPPACVPGAKINTHEGMPMKKGGFISECWLKSQRREDTSQRLIWVTGKSIYLFVVFAWPLLSEGDWPRTRRTNMSCEDIRGEEEATNSARTRLPQTQGETSDCKNLWWLWKWEKRLVSQERQLEGPTGS